MIKYFAPAETAHSRNLLSDISSFILRILTVGSVKQALLCKTEMKSLPSSLFFNANRNDRRIYSYSLTTSDERQICSERPCIASSTIFAEALRELVIAAINTFVSKTTRILRPETLRKNPAILWKMPCNRINTCEILRQPSRRYKNPVCFFRPRWYETKDWLVPSGLVRYPGGNT